MPRFVAFLKSDYQDTRRTRRSNGVMVEAANSTSAKHEASKKLMVPWQDISVEEEPAKRPGMGSWWFGK